MAAFRVRTLEDLHDFFFLLTLGKIMNLVEGSGYEVDITADDLLEGGSDPLEELIEVATEERLLTGFRSAWNREELQAFSSRMRQRLASRAGPEFAPDSFLEDDLPAFMDLFLSTGRYDLDEYFDVDLFLHLYATCYPIIRDALPHAPPEVLDLLVRLVNPRPGENVCDPAGCDFIPLLRAYQHVEELEGEDPAASLFYGQIFASDPELPPGRSLWYRLYACCRVLCSTPDATVGVTTGNTLLTAPFRRLTDLQETAFDCVISTPPWDLGGYGKERLKKTDAWWRRFPWGVPSGRSADWAFVQVAVSMAGDGGRVGVVVDRSALNREGEDERIRSALIEENLIECAVLLPEQIYTKTQFQTCNDQCAILLLRKGQRLQADPPEPGTILFINAQALHENRVDGSPLQKLTENAIDEILLVYERSVEGEHFSRRVAHDEIRANGSSLDPERYVPAEDGLDYECAMLRNLVLDAAWGISSGSVTGQRVRVVRARDIDPDGEILSSSISRETIDPATPDGARLEKGDVLISFWGAVPTKIAMYEGIPTTIYPHRELLRLRPDPRRVLAPYLLSLLRILKDTRHFRSNDRDSLLEEVLDLAIVVPPHSRQAEIRKTLANNPGMQSFIAGLLTAANRESE
ncbi:N-6 DNA methylase [Methanoculleus horonobensis]|uniref:N-6 DNA methylase n=1 Tax=Methanoculleus horonobensis TaxID=528314 RepID=UPI00137364FB|nr:N-6 DNA methylase [Methanoculleus horonobensis]